MLSAVILSPSAYAQSAFEDPGARGAAAGGGGTLVPVTPKVAAGGVRLGSTAQVVVLFRNDAGQPLKTGAINLYPSSNIQATIGENQCAKAAIEPAEVCPISLTVKGLQQGAYRIEMLMRHEGRAKLLTATIEGTVDGSGDETSDLASDIETIPNEIDFGTLDESQEQVKALILRNKTSKPITIDKIEIQSGNQSGFSVDENCGELATGSACVASVRWSPTSKGPFSGSLIVRHSGPTGVASVDLEGVYDPDQSEAAKTFPEAVPGKGLLVSSMEEVDFGSGVSQSSSITVSLVNIGGVPLTLNGIRMTNTENGVRAETSGCKAGKILDPLEACPLTLTWEPVREGTIFDDVQVTHNGARGILVMPLRGNAARAINKDSKAIVLGGVGEEDFLQNIRPLSLDDIGEDADETPGDAMKKALDSTKAPATSTERVMPKKDLSGALEGYVITSYSAKRAIIAGPGGSRVVFGGEQSVIGGVLWEIVMRPSAVEFRNGDQKVLLLFDKSLSSVNVVDTQSSSGADAGSSGASATTSSTATTTTP